MVIFRWKSRALLGTRCATRSDALSDALKYGQALPAANKRGPIILKHFAVIERLAAAA